ncbi:MAG: preprotein translocase subunit SecG [Campylobacterota bacterium]|nr:preprotein translocase subunit SecG [Campylobacterota bacterium]
MTSTLLIVQIILALAITIAVLLQKSSSIGLGAYSGSNESMFGAKGPMGFLAKITFGLALLFVLNTLVLGYLYTVANNKTVADTIASSVPVSPEAAKTTAPAAPSTPTAPAKGPESTIPVPPKVDTPQSQESSGSEETPKPATH